MSQAFALETRELSKIAGVSMGAIYAAHCRFGNFRGIVPLKLPSGHLLWPRGEVEQAFGIFRPIVSLGDHHLVGLAAMCGIPRVAALFKVADILTNCDNDELGADLLAQGGAELLKDMAVAFACQIERVQSELSTADRSAVLKAARIIRGLMDQLCGSLEEVAA